MFSATATTPLFSKLPLMSNPFLIHNSTTTTALLVPKPPFSFSPSLLPSRPFKNLNLCSFPSWASLTKKSPFTSVISHVARTVYQKQEEEGSNWQFQEEDKENEADWEEGEGGEEEESGGEAGFSEEWGGESYPEPPEEAKLFVGNLPYDVDSEKLAQIFDQAGVVEVSEVIYNRDTEQSRGFGFVTMSTVEEAEKAVEMFHRYDISGRLLTVNKAAPRGSRPELTPRMANPSCRMYVGNLPWQVDNYRLEQVFSEHGKVVEARVVYDRETGRSRGFGFVTMSSESELNDAIAALDGQSLDGRALRVSVAEERQRQHSTF